MGIFKVKRDEHLVRDTEFVRFLRRELRDPGLFTGYNMKARRWFLALWVNKDQGVAQDIDDLGENMELATQELVAQLSRSRHGVTGEDIKKGLLRAERTRQEKEEQIGQELQDAQNWVMKKSGSTVPVFMG